MAELLFERLDELEAKLREVALEAAYLVVWDRSEPGQDERLARIDLPSGGDVVALALAWLRDLALEQVADKGWRRFRVKVYSVNGQKTLATGTFVARDPHFVRTRKHRPRSAAARSSGESDAPPESVPSGEENSPSVVLSEVPESSPFVVSKASADQNTNIQVRMRVLASEVLSSRRRRRPLPSPSPALLHQPIPFLNPIVVCAIVSLLRSPRRRRKSCVAASARGLVWAGAWCTRLESEDVSHASSVRFFLVQRANGERAPPISI